MEDKKVIHCRAPQLTLSFLVMKLKRSKEMLTMDQKYRIKILHRFEAKSMRQIAQKTENTTLVTRRNNYEKIFVTHIDGLFYSFESFRM